MLSMLRILLVTSQFIDHTACTGAAHDIGTGIGQR